MYLQPYLGIIRGDDSNCGDKHQFYLEYLQSDKKIKTLTDTAELVEEAVHSATMEQQSDTLNSILKWSQNNKTRKFDPPGTRNKVQVKSNVGDFAFFQCLVDLPGQK